MQRIRLKRERTGIFIEYRFEFCLIFAMCFSIGESHRPEKSYREIAFSTIPFEFNGGLDFGTCYPSSIIFHPPRAHLCGYPCSTLCRCPLAPQSVLSGHFHARSTLTTARFSRSPVERRRNLSRAIVYFDNSETTRAFAVIPSVSQ